MTYPVSEDYTTSTNFVLDRGTATSTGGRLRPGATNAVANIGHSSATDADDQYAEVVIATCQNTSEAGCYVRFQSFPKYYQANIARNGANYDYFIYFYDGSAFRTLKSSTGNSLSLPATLRLTAIGTRLTMSIGGTTVLEADEDSLDVGRPGGYVWSSSAVADAELESASFVIPSAYTTPYKKQLIGTASNTNATGPPNTLSVSFPGTIKPVAGDKIIISIARDNITNDPATGDSVTTTPGGETYTRVPLAQPSGTSTAAAGIVGAMFFGDVVTDWPSGTNTITVTMATGAADRVMHVQHWKNLGALRGTADTAGSTTNASVTTTDPVNGDAVVAMSCWEHSTASTITQDTDTTNGFWSELSPWTAFSSGGTTTAAVKLTCQHKLVTATGSQTYNPTNSTTTDSVAIALTFQPASTATSATLGNASVGTTAYGLTGTDRTLPAATPTITAFGLTGQARSLASAIATVVANAISGTRNVPAASVAVNALNLTQTRNANLGTATMPIVANSFTYLSGLMQSATVGIEVFDTQPFIIGDITFDVGLTPPAASVTVTAYNLTALVSFTATVNAAAVGVTANNLSTNGRGLGTGTVGVSGNPLSPNAALTLPQASVPVTANAVSTTGVRNLQTTNVTLSANPLSTAGYTLAQASIGIIAQNLALTGNFNLQSANVGITAFNLLNQTTTQSLLGTGAVSVNAFNLAVALSTGQPATVGVVANALAHGAATAAATAAVTGYGLGQVRTALLGLASVAVSAYNLANVAPGTAVLGSANVATTGFALQNLLMLSAGLASVSVNANPLGRSGDSTSTGSVSTAAYGLSSTRAIANGAVDVSAYSITLARMAAVLTATVGVAAYGLTVDQGNTRGTIRTHKPLVLINGGRVLAGVSGSYPLTFFKKPGPGF